MYVHCFKCFKKIRDRVVWENSKSYHTECSSIQDLGKQTSENMFLALWEKSIKNSFKLYRDKKDNV